MIRLSRQARTTAPLVPVFTSFVAPSISLRPAVPDGYIGAAATSLPFSLMLRAGRYTLSYTPPLAGYRLGGRAPQAGFGELQVGLWRVGSGVPLSTISSLVRSFAPILDVSG